MIGKPESSTSQRDPQLWVAACRPATGGSTKALSVDVPVQAAVSASMPSHGWTRLTCHLMTPLGTQGLVVG